MKKIFVIPALFILFAVLACTSSREAMNLHPQKVLDENVPSSGGKHFLWKVSDENSFVWLLGSIHFADSSFYPMDTIIEDAFDWAEELGVEIDVSDDSVSAEIGKKSMNQGLLPQGMLLSDVLPRNLWVSLGSICASWNYPVQTLLHFRPWFAAMMLSSVAILRTGITPEFGIDNVLMARAVDEGKMVVGLETVEEQVSALSGSENSDSAGIYYMKNTLREIGTLDSIIGGMVIAWKTGNDSLMSALADAESGSCRPEDDCEVDTKLKGEIEDRLYNSRNEKMAESIENFLKENRKIFVVVGAAHLALEKGNVISLLKEKGYKVERF